MPTKDRILVVDDNPESVWPLINYLEPDYEVVYATTSEKAFALAFSANRPDLILLDIMMPDMDGYQVFTKLKDEAYTQDIPIIFLTALTEYREEAKGLELGAQDFIVKPYSLPVVGARIKSVLDLKKELNRRVILKGQLEDMNHQLEQQVQTKMKELSEARETLHSYQKKYDHLFKETPPPPPSQKILVVDDNPANIHFLMAALEDEYQILFATSGGKALEIANSENRPDVVLLDIMMPEMDGFEVCSRLKASAETWDIPVIFITALDQEVDETKGLNLGAVDFIIKPFSMPVVKARLKAALRLKEEMDNRIILTRKLEDLNSNLETRVQEKTVALKQAHENLLESEKKYRTLYETAIEGIFETTPHGRFISASPSLARMLGYESSMDLVSTIKDAARQLYVTPEDRDRFVAELEEKGEIFNFETKFKKKQGEVIWILMCAKRVKSESSKQTHYQGFIIDISKQKKIQLDNLQYLRELRLLNQIIAVSVIEAQNGSILETACKELSNTFHLPQTMAVLLNKEQSEAQVAAEYISPKNGPDETRLPFLNQSVSLEEYPSVAQLIMTTSPLVIQDVRDDDRLTPFASILEERQFHSILLAPLLIEGKTAGGLVMGALEANFFTDDKIRLVQSVADQISGVLARIQLDENKRQLEKQYYQAQKMEAIGTLTGGIAHDFNNILTIIMSISDLMRRTTEPDSQLYPGLDHIYTASGRAASLVRQLMAFSRQQVLQPKKLDLNYTLQQFEKMLRRVIGEDVELVTDLDPDLGFVKADEGQMEQVIMNLVVNAKHAMPQGGRLTIETANVVLDEVYAGQHLDVKPGSYVMVAVSDSGIGIEKSNLSHIFEPFFTTKAKDKGTGLGLSTVHGIVNQSGGHVLVYSELGQGTCFKIYLPRYEKETSTDDADQQQRALSSIVGGSETILVVEDDEILRDIIAGILTEFGYTVLTADRASAATEIFDTHTKEIDLLLTDVIMPGEEDGVSLSRKLCSEHPRLKVIFMSGYTNSAMIQQRVLDRGRAYLQKPFLSEDLAQKVRMVLDVTK